MAFDCHGQPIALRPTSTACSRNPPHSSICMRSWNNSNPPSKKFSPVLRLLEALEFCLRCRPGEVGHKAATLTMEERVFPRSVVVAFPNSIFLRGLCG